MTGPAGPSESQFMNIAELNWSTIVFSFFLQPVFLYFSSSDCCNTSTTTDSATWLDLDSLPITCPHLLFLLDPLYTSLSISRKILDCCIIFKLIYLVKSFTAIDSFRCVCICMHVLMLFLQHYGALRRWFLALHTQAAIGKQPLFSSVWRSSATAPWQPASSSTTRISLQISQVNPSCFP